MREIHVRGEKPLYGSVHIHGAKNSVLPILAATILHPGISVIENCPRLSDVETATSILRYLGAEVCRTEDSLIVNAASLHVSEIPEQLMREMRSSVIFLGAMLARFSVARLSYPGGCELGPRPIDLHLYALTQLGASFDEDSGTLHACAAKLRAAAIHLATPSVGATENAMLAAVGAEGTTEIHNAAREPEIEDLQDFLRSLGVKVFGAGSSTVTVEGTRKTHDARYRIRSDRIVAASYLAAVVAAGGEAELKDAEARRLYSVIASFREMGAEVRKTENGLFISRQEPLRSPRSVRTSPYPGFPTDAQAILMAASLKARGTSVFVENIFENRYRHVDELDRMGADIYTEGRVAIVRGVEALKGASVRCTDLRGGAALVIAALSAHGESRISAIRHIERGYEDISRDLALLGADIRTAEQSHDR